MLPFTTSDSKHSSHRELNVNIADLFLHCVAVTSSPLLYSPHFVYFLSFLNKASKDLRLHDTFLKIYTHTI